ncbi:hypothetical protein PoB_006253000 [Plakobranchus ocellatus]|uniref:DUF19 domain-containing protein n=1 Tax=Plakobranchus ocellatus TaxID=259542 RepID=A0AAV4CVY6_9GAST|nr:hypothetical protein PoB_006253000 [Plakobranchus ocellatus]
MRIQVCFCLALASCILLGFLCETSTGDCAALKNNADLNCTTEYNCTKSSVLKYVQLKKNVREFLCSNNGTKEARAIIGVDECAGKTSVVKKLKKDVEKCLKTHTGSMTGINCTVVEEARECIEDLMEDCSSEAALFMDHAFDCRVKVYWPSCE